MIDSIFIFGAKYLFISSFIIVGFYFWRQAPTKRLEMLLFLLLSLSLIDIIAIIASQIYNNPRPFVSDGIIPLIIHDAVNGFPSGHTLITAALASALIFLDRRVGTILFLIAAFVAYSRVYVGVHHYIDIVGSFVITIVVTSAVYLLLRRFGFLVQNHFK